MIFLCFSERRRGRFLGILQTDWRTVRVGHLRERARECSHYKQSSDRNSHCSFLGHTSPPPVLTRKVFVCCLSQLIYFQARKQNSPHRWYRRCPCTSPL